MRHVPVVEIGKTNKWSELAADTVVRAFVISFLLHAVAFGGWKLGNSFGWWKNMSVPAWFEKIQTAMIPTPVKKAMTPLPQEQSLLFVEVDPEELAEPPKQTKFYGAKSSQAANVKRTIDSDAPQIEGKQKDVLKVTDNSKPKAQPLQPTPESTPQKEFSEAKSQPEKIRPKGDLAFAKPQEQRQNQGESAQEQKMSRPKPRTLAEAKSKSGTLGERMQQEGGVKKLSMSSSLDVKGTAIGDYDARFIEAVKQRWYTLLDEINASKAGKVILEFQLHHDGRITDMKVIQNTVGEVEGLVCQKAILDPSPFARWPSAMRLEMKSDSREVTFTFYYQ